MQSMFPCWRYHRTEPARIFRNLEELELAGEGWADTPAAFANEPESQQTEAESQQAFNTAAKKGGRRK